METVRVVLPVLLGIVMPPVAALVLPERWHGLARLAAALALAIAVAGGSSLFTGHFLLDAAVIVLGSQVSYHFLWKPTSHRGPRDRVPVRIRSDE